MHQEVITLEGRKIFDKLKNFSDFYLAGGTGLALDLGHRISVDFDFFWDKDIPEGLLSKTRKVFNGHKIELIVDHPEQLGILVDGISISFVRYPFPVILKLVQHSGINILSSLEIAAMKAYVLGRRAALKDYIDLYFLIKENIGDLEDIIKLCDKKYGSQFNKKLFLEQLIYLDDIKDEEIRFLKAKVTKKQVEDFLRKEVSKIEFR
ncbi:nucleotidyl transferase AbiEii/AbiGii toxin family protein [Patescibacteria group bacterium]|nr:nucleotidyl transferase AbiEii/AbiGii toxin family protein [Patescibacteria group bacterium]MBU4023164.1 nucleotidyl transferase AbiEii/AbiGii toxin family protein [Patescibacteria group bacterium]